MKKFYILLFLALFLFQIPCPAKHVQNTDDTIKYLNMAWWQNYNDENLCDNLLLVYKSNYDLKNAALKVRENEQIVKMQFANELPQIGLSADLNRDLRAPMQQFGNMSIPKYSQYNYYIPISASYEVDIWGTNRLKTKSEKERLEIIKQAQRATYIALSCDFAADYFNLIKADELIKIQDELIKIQEETVLKIKDKYETGLCSVNELLEEERVLTRLKEEKNSHIKTRDMLIDTMRVYLSNSEADIKRSDYSNLKIVENLPLEYQSDIISNRPDYIQEEANIKRVGFDVRVAKREFLPKFVIFGQIGLNAYHLGTLFNSASQLFNAGILPSFDIFSGGRKLALLRLRKYEYEEALNSYQKTALQGIKEVNSALVDYKQNLKNYDESLERLKLQNKTFELVNDKREIGAASDLDVLYAKTAYLIVQKEEVSNKINTLLSTIGLYRASGGVDLCNYENI